MTIAVLASTEAYALLDVPRLHAFLRAMKQPDAAFTMHRGGETDVRGTYCAMAVASLCGLLVAADEGEEGLGEGVAGQLAGCQTYEGGFGARQGLEAHGGYTFCALAALKILGCVSLLDVDLLLVRPSCVIWPSCQTRTDQGLVYVSCIVHVQGCW